MKKEIIRSCFCGIIAGVILYFIGLTTSDLLYMNLSDNWIDVLTILLSLFGAAICVVTILFKKPPIGFMILRALILLVFFVITLLFNASIGFVVHLHNFLNYSTSAAMENVSGMVLAFFIICIIFSCIVTLVVAAIVKTVMKKHLYKNNSIEK